MNHFHALYYSLKLLAHYEEVASTNVSVNMVSFLSI